LASGLPFFAKVEPEPGPWVWSKKKELENKIVIREVVAENSQSRAAGD
jgi:hypothetical protein